MKGTSQRLPPLVAAAMVSIIMFCGAGVAAILGVMPAEGRSPTAHREAETAKAHRG